ncbi:hypothetical protein [Myxococcus xanthus]|uniref:hypothetical protein n=1 Tax=Myxococcus xanthus TaxID=34 RepID=UPI001CECB219|nr:hypothetical protein [Myxococcus xanthus]
MDPTGGTAPKVCVALLAAGAAPKVWVVPTGATGGAAPNVCVGLLAAGAAPKACVVPTGATGGTAPNACVALSAPCPFDVTAPYDCVVVVTDEPAVAPGGVPAKSCVDFMLERAGPAPPVTAGVDREGGGAPCGVAMNT